MAPDRLLRCCVLKHLKAWSFRELERELRSNLIYRRFTHFDAEATPDLTVFSRTFALLGPSVTEKIHQRVVGLAGKEGVAEGRKIAHGHDCRGSQRALSNRQHAFGRRHPRAQPQPEMHRHRVQEQAHWKW